MSAPGVNTLVVVHLFLQADLPNFPHNTFSARDVMIICFNNGAYALK